MKQYTNFKLTIKRKDNVSVETVSNLYWKGALLTILISHLGFLLLGLYSLTVLQLPKTCTVLLYILFILGSPLTIAVVMTMRKQIIIMFLTLLLMHYPVCFMISLYLFKYIFKII